MVCTSQNKGLIAASEYGLNPECHIYQMPEKQVIAQFTMQTKLRSIAMAFSRDGKYLLMIGGVPDFTISIYDIQANAFFITPVTKLPFKHTQLRQNGVQFNPRCSEQFSILSDNKIYFYTLKQAFMKSEAEMLEDDQFMLSESYRFDVQEFSASQIPSNDDVPVVFSSLKWDMWNMVTLCTNKPAIYQVSTYEQTSLNQTFELPQIPLTTVLTHQNLIVSTEDGMLTWYKVEQPYADQNGQVDATFFYKIESQIEYEYNFYEQRAKVVPQDQAEHLTAPIAYLKYSRNHQTLVFGTQNGTIGKIPFAAQKVEEEDEETQEKREKVVLDTPMQHLGQFHTAAVLGIRELPDSTQFITISEDNMICMWEATNQQLLSVTPLIDRPVSLAVDTQGMAAFIGTENGAFLVFDVSDRTKPRLVKQMRFFQELQPLDLVVASLDGKILICTSTKSDKVFCMSQQCSQNYTVFGFIQMSGIILSMSFLFKDNVFWVAAVLSNNLIQVCKLPSERQENRFAPIPEKQTETSYRKVDPGTNLIMTTRMTTRIYVTGEDKFLKQYDNWPSEHYEDIDWRKPAVQPNDEFISHSIATTCVHFSLELKKMATGGKDGLVIVRDPLQVRNLKEFQTHSVIGGGISSIAMSAKLPFVYVCGVDGSILIVAIDEKSKFPTEPVKLRPSDEMRLLETVPALEVEDMKLFTDVMQEEFQAANLEKKEIFKKKIMDQLGIIQKKLRDLLSENERVSAIEKLERDEFVIDCQKQDQFIQEGDNVCSDIRIEAEKTNLRLEMLRERVIDTTWNKMEVNSTALKSIQNDSLLFNFSIRKREPSEQKVLMFIINQRKMELMEKYRKMELKLKDCLNMSDFSTQKEGYFMNRYAGKPSFMTDDAIAEAAAEFARKHAEKMKERNQAEQQNNAANNKDEGRKPYLKITKGRLGTKVRKQNDGDDVVVKQTMERDIKGMEDQHWKVVFLERELDDLKKSIEDPKPNIYDLLYECYELYTDQRKRSQIEMIREVVFELKRDYNKEFAQLDAFKQEQIYIIKEKNEAIMELQENLKQEPTLYVAKTDPLENPKNIFEVKDDEIKVEKYLTAEEKERLAEEERKRLEREAKLKGDTVGMRGLMTMMNGELIFKKEKNLLEAEFTKEEWMNKPEDEMNDDEKQRLREFQQKEKEFKEKQRKAWEFTLKNIRNEIVDIEYKFEERFLSLNKKRLFFEQRILEQELYMIRLIMMMHESRETRASKDKYTNEIEQMMQKLDEKRTFLQNCTDQIVEFQKDIAMNEANEKEQIRELEILCKTEQLTKKEYLEFITKGKPQCRVKVPAEQVQQLRQHIIELDPYCIIDDIAIRELIKKMEQRELYDFDRDRPGPSIEKDQFDRMVDERNKRIKMEKAKEINNKRLTNLKDFIKYYESTIVQMQDQLDVISNKQRKTLARIDKLKYNFEVIVYLKQGQVEVPQLPVATDYKDAILIQRSEIEFQNEHIRKRGTNKVNAMISILMNNLRVKQVKYENKRLKTEKEHFEELAKDVQLYRVTKQTQEIIQGKNVKKEEDDKKRLDSQKEQLLNNCQNRINAIKSMQAKLRKEIREKIAENEQLESKARQLKQNVEQRQQIQGLQSNTNNSADSDPRQKIKEIANQRRLMDVIKQQEEEIMFLKDELDKLRARTFPSFAHLQNKLEHPDSRV